MASGDDILRALARQQFAGRNSSPVDRFLTDALTEAGGKIAGGAQSVARALMTPGDAMRGAYNYAEINPDGSVNPVPTAMIDDAANMAGVISLGAMPMVRPSGSLGMGGNPKPLPWSDSFATPSTPTPELMARFGRVEKVPVSNARATNVMQWDRFNAGDHPPEVVKGYADKPVAIKKEDGEYLIVDGHHRTALQAEGGSDFVEMYVIDAKDYDPSNAGKKRRASEDTQTLDELFTALFGDD